MQVGLPVASVIAASLCLLSSSWGPFAVESPAAHCHCHCDTGGLPPQGESQPASFSWPYLAALVAFLVGVALGFASGLCASASFWAAWSTASSAGRLRGLYALTDDLPPIRSIRRA